MRKKNLQRKASPTKKNWKRKWAVRVLHAAGHHSLEREQEVLQLRDRSSQRHGIKIKGERTESPIEGLMPFDDQCPQVVHKLRKNYKKVVTMSKNSENELKPMSALCLSLIWR